MCDPRVVPLKCLLSPRAPSSCLEGGEAGPWSSNIQKKTCPQMAVPPCRRAWLPDAWVS